MSKSKVIVGAALVLSGALGVGVAQARDLDLQWSVVIGTPFYTPAVPVHVRPLPVYHQPAHGHQRSVYQQPTRWDRDGDGIPNRRDRHYNPAWDRDGDGVHNRHDRYPGRGGHGR
jgi:hypothetical protein